MTGPTPALDVANLPFVEELYNAFQRAPATVPDEWRRYFESLGNGEHATDSGVFAPPPTPAAHVGPDTTDPLAQYRVDQLVRAYRVRGHIAAKLDPLGRPRPAPPELSLAHHGLTEADFAREFHFDTKAGLQRLPLADIISRLEAVYCGSVGAQFMHIDDTTVRQWLQRRIEDTGNRTVLSRDVQLRILNRLTDADVFEEFIRKKFIAAKSFSLEGAESLVPLLDLAINHAAEQGIHEIVLGMAHRGRLNLLANVLGKDPREIFREFEDRLPFTGDVKYHLGHSGTYVTHRGRRLHLSLAFNPSHLEFVNPVVLGRVRAKQDRGGDIDRRTGLALLIHGDAAFIGQGIVAETLNLSRLCGYTVGGTVHILVNNQLGFTTPPVESRSTTYATSVAKMLGSPILHVNGEDPEAVAHCIQLALDFREKFKRDVFIDMYCYRRLGHNETDEPSFTQPQLYRVVERRPSVREGYLKHLLKLGGVTRQEADAIADRRRQDLERHLAAARQDDIPASEPPTGIWAGYLGGPVKDADEPVTAVQPNRLGALLHKQTELPPGFTLHPKLKRFMSHRQAMARGEEPFDWSAAEAVAFATVAMENRRVRLSGQDTERGTFSHRHAVLHDHETGGLYVPLANLAPGQAPVEIFNSPLSEAGVLGFEYGYSLDYPDALVLWEAQFGDFINTAQVIVDQFISSAEDKWRRLSGLVLLLPHGFEGQGPEHSSARLERFLQLAAEDNIQVAQPTTPAQYFHLLRRQALRRWRKPLVVFTPKSLLRHPKSVSPLDDLAKGRFECVLPDPRRDVRKIWLCTGKIFFELQERQPDDIALVRLEQLYPFPIEDLRRALEPYRADTPVVWVQDEPANMGAWSFLRPRWELPWPLQVVCRPESASPATGSHRAHQQEQRELLEAAL